MDCGRDYKAPTKDQRTLTREKAKFHKAKKSCKPGARKRVPVSNSTESIVKKTRGILNKLTMDNFDKLVSKFQELPLEGNDKRISYVVSHVFEKAINEPLFSAVYARTVWTVCKTSQEETSRKFGEQIINRCQIEFQNCEYETNMKALEQKLLEVTEQSPEQIKLYLEEKKLSDRKRSLGNVRFIGELYKVQILSPMIMVECVHSLLCYSDEENVEILCTLLTIVGQKLGLQLKTLEDSAKRGGSVKFVPEHKWMDKIISILKKRFDDKTFSWRVRFKILDVVELWENDWKPRRDINASRTAQEVGNHITHQDQEEKWQSNSLLSVENNTCGGGGSGSTAIGLLAENNSRLESPLSRPEYIGDISKSAKNSFQEYLAAGKMLENALHRIKTRFPGQKMDAFINEISRQVAVMSEEVEPKFAGGLVRLLIKKGEISKDTIIKLMAHDIMVELPDISLDFPMATTNLAQFLVEIFFKENNFDWLTQIGDK